MRPFPAPTEMASGNRPAPVSTTTDGRAIEPKAFASRRWYRCLRALGLGMRGIYARKDTFVSTALQAGVKVAWLEAQMGVAYATLKRHYGKWTTPAGESELDRFAKLEPTLFPCEEGDEKDRGDSQGTVRPQRRDFVRKSKGGGGDLNPPAAPERLKKSRS